MNGYTQNDAMFGKADGPHIKKTPIILVIHVKFPNFQGVFFHMRIKQTLRWKPQKHIVIEADESIKGCL